MVQFELLVLPCILSITFSLIWALILVRDTYKIAKSFKIIAFVISFVSVVMFMVSLFNIIENFTLEAPKRIWETPFQQAWILLIFSFSVIYLGHLIAPSAK